VSGVDEQQYAFEDPRTALARHGLRAKKRFSQSFLTSPHAVRTIAEATGAGPGTVVVELGAGLGTLTAALHATGARVIAVERDRDMLAVLEQDLAPRGVRVLAADAASLDYAALAREQRSELVVAGNIPYAITGAILRGVVAAREHVPRAVLMVQREVRDRLQAPPGTREYGALTVFTCAAYAPSTVTTLSPSCFHPQPKVHSAVVRLDRRQTPLAEETDAFQRSVRGIFQSRRKTLRNALASAWSAPAIEAAMAALGLPATTRGETLSPERLAALAEALERASSMVEAPP
jgi:16S rRNA (adenine1518-N6/adenine1519-N6)-dimethyltransferase